MSYQSSHHAPQGHSASSRQFAVYNPVATAAAPAGTFLPGTKVQVGGHRVIVEKYLSEGGFAHVYVVRLSSSANGSETAVLKRVAVPDKASLANMRTEVETMKKLKGHRHIVKYIDSHASQLRGGGYEVFLLMEYCAGGGLIDFMNTRLQNRLTEPEIIKIFSDVAEGVACMHYLKPPLLHRDLKVENVLISRTGGSPIYKLCDFGSTAPPPPRRHLRRGGSIDRGRCAAAYNNAPIDEKSDIWALGVLLYKLCYYTTPFEEVGQMAILNATFKYPSYPQFSDRLKLLIASMLKENPQKRPNIYEVVREACHMQGKEVPIKDIYSNRTASESRKYQELPPTPTEAPTGLRKTFSPPMQETQIIPEIAPMRRGRPDKPHSSQHGSAKPSSSPYKDDGKASTTDPFAILDGASRKQTDEELSNRFPSLDQFDILHEKGDKFEFEPAKEAKSEDDDLSQRLTNALADEAFGRPASPERKPQPANRRSQASPIRSSVPQEARKAAPLYQPTPTRPKMNQTRPAGPSIDSHHQKSRDRLSQVWAEEEKNNVPSPSSGLRPQASPRLSSDRVSKLSNSAHPSMETLRRDTLDAEEPVGRSHSATSKPRPVSVNLSARYESSHDSDPSRSSLDLIRAQYEDGAPLRATRTEVDRDFDRSNISSDMDFLRVKEEEESARKREKLLSSGGSKHGKRTSLTGLTISGGKSLLGGRFGEAFRRFEQDKFSSTEDVPSQDTLIPGLTSGKIPSENYSAYEETALEEVDGDDISPEMRRELERRRLSQEEKRVANAAAEYRRRVAEGELGGRAGAEGLRSRAIQSRVQTLIGETNKAAVSRTATGYGRYTDTGNLQAKPGDVQASVTGTAVSQTTGPVYGGRNNLPTPVSRRDGASAPAGIPQTTTSSAPRPGLVPRPAAPPKPKNLRVGTGDLSQPAEASVSQDRSPSVPRSAAQGEDWEADFSKRFPSLSGLEVETEIELPKYPKVRTREV
ncbi:hypothetical protein N7468_001498 [Penicillium chermesinum]|uniref:non-specific serine/threonine protein kinase n=1 Tax=Penicillium chermesinum TaxID=63820 RepID=A0A9W9PGS2_9EURO|nr:uncharacterized protein N7468_001498 [Penicillium chermesinum]KAJ5246515.1 hypothetical protein N7468_001498 [Penicillium chermesinum]